VRIRSLDLGHLVEYHLDEGPTYDGVMDLAKAAIERMGVRTGLEMDLTSDAPPGSGLGGSSALVTAVVGALAALFRSDDVAGRGRRLAYAVERRTSASPVGGRTSTRRRSGGFNLPRVLGVGRDRDAGGVPRSAWSASGRAAPVLHGNRAHRPRADRHPDPPVPTRGARDARRHEAPARDGRTRCATRSSRGELDDLGACSGRRTRTRSVMNPHIADGTHRRALPVARGRLARSEGRSAAPAAEATCSCTAWPKSQAAVRAALRAHGGQFADFRVPLFGRSRPPWAHGRWRPYREGDASCSWTATGRSKRGGRLRAGAGQLTADPRCRREPSATCGPLRPRRGGPHEPIADRSRAG